MKLRGRLRFTRKDPGNTFRARATRMASSAQKKNSMWFHRWSARNTSTPIYRKMKVSARLAAILKKLWHVSRAW